MVRVKYPTGKSIVIGVLVGVGLLLFLIGIWGYGIVWGSNYFPSQTSYVYVDESKSFDDLCSQLSTEGKCEKPGHFKLLAKIVKYKDRMRTGRYAIHPGMNNITLLKDLIRGHQEAVGITFNSIRLKTDLAQKLASQLMLKESELLSLLNDTVYCASIGFSSETITTLFIPNTYEVYWNISARKLISRMKKEYDRFWTPERQGKAKNLNLTPVQVSILASIVEQETADTTEYAIIAGLYLNRLRIGMPLQADPTVKFAIGDFTLRRILYEHLQVESPYNTYKNTGLPPGPLCIPGIRSIDSVLNSAKHNYLYMCAKEDLSGKHNFANTIGQHNRNALLYRRALNKRNIR